MKNMIIMNLILMLFLMLSRSDFITGEELIIGNDGFIPQKDSVYINGAIALDKHPKYYLTSFIPLIQPGKLHHFGIFACKEPGSTLRNWNSVKTEKEFRQSDLPTASTCKDVKEYDFHEYILYAWSYNTSNLVLPKDVAYEVGWETDHRYLVYEIHYPYADAFKDGFGDYSKVIIKYQTEKTLYGAGYLGSAPTYYSVFPPKQNASLEMAITMTTVLHPIFYQVHTHLIGTKVSGYVVKFNERDDNGTMQWTQIGMRDPMIPQLWMPVDNKVTMEPNDIFAVRCHYYNYHDRYVHSGVTEEDEMCNFYIIYWTEWDKVLNSSFIPQPTKTFEQAGLKNIPEDA